MDFFLSPFFIFSLFSIFINFTPPAHLLSLKCSPSPNYSNQTNASHNVNPIEPLLDNLTSAAPNSHTTTLNATFGRGWYTGLMQCRPGIGPKKCTLCANIARNTILSLCQNRNSVSAWFDGCYVQIISMSSSDDSALSYMNISNHSCSSRAKNKDPARFAPALETLLLKLRADVNIPTHHGFSHGKITYQNTDHNYGKIYGLVECLGLLSTQECDSCVRIAIEKIQFYCTGKIGGALVYGLCLVRFESDEFYHGYVNISAGDGSFTVWEGENGGRKKNLFLAYWGGGVACFLVVVLLVWLLRRTVMDRAKVGTLGSADTDEMAACKTDN